MAELDSTDTSANTPTVDLSLERTKWSAGTIIRRILWGVVWTIFFRLSPRPKFDAWRVMLLRLFGAKIGSRVIISNSVKVLYPWNLEIGDNSWVGWHVDIYNYAPVKIGSNSVVSQYSYLCTGTHDYTRRGFPLTWAPITVGDNAWVAADCFLAPGVTIGSGAIIASRSVVTKDMPEWKICAGHPCQPIKDRPPIEKS
ncbi:WcaF family extracellular polysaccharide biosynthesis acetyltransferase [Kamptonema cortianum]|nr:WcaF family extracellular polysaccharide biosynthesis acetyltransferase [Geitlerinema splendidum]MDK3158837.1 WcaF family extracellular polysaccharide biosynthesis acetyltransferase [Kamptonema cortianum]